MRTHLPLFSCPWECRQCQKLPCQTILDLIITRCIPPDCIWALCDIVIVAWFRTKACILRLMIIAYHCRARHCFNRRYSRAVAFRNSNCPSLILCIFQVLMCKHHRRDLEHSTTYQSLESYNKSCQRVKTGKRSCYLAELEWVCCFIRYVLIPSPAHPFVCLALADMIMLLLMY